jgi:uncharacterized membrane protein
MPIAYTLHLLAAILWVGGMFFAHMVLRPAAIELDPAQRLPLWLRVFGRFFPVVWGAVVLLPATGYWMVHEHGGMAAVGVPVHIMQGVGWIMIALFLTLFFGPYRAMKAAVAAGELSEAGRRQNQIRLIVTANLHMGLTITALVAVTRWL